MSRRRRQLSTAATGQGRERQGRRGRAAVSASRVPVRARSRRSPTRGHEIPRADITALDVGSRQCRDEHERARARPVLRRIPWFPDTRVTDAELRTVRRSDPPSRTCNTVSPPPSQESSSPSASRCTVSVGRRTPRRMIRLKSCATPSTAHAVSSSPEKSCGTSCSSATGVAAMGQDHRRAVELHDDTVVTGEGRERS